MQSVDYLEFWYQALREPVGICILTTDVERLRQKLYAVRRTSDDPELDKLFVTLSPTSADRVWIMRKEITEQPDA